ncbi:MAG: DUF1127 domain-containing protein [Acetobacteraceae bacterium]|nr:DUF1127 domain-containing protein [Acetobacteraceae bacterium]
MNAPLAKEQIELLMSDTLTYRVAPVQGMDEAAVRSASSGIIGRLAGAVRFLIELPRRRAVLDELSRLSDRELADIGLNRADLTAVFAKAR